MRVKTHQAKGRDVRCLIADEGKTYVTNYDFKKAVGFDPSYQADMLARQEILMARRYKGDFPEDLFFHGDKLKLISLEGLKKAVESTWQPQEKKDVALKVIRELEGQEVDTNPSVLTFDFGQNQVRTLLDEQGEPWFVAKDVADVLGYTNPPKAVRDHCKGSRTIRYGTSQQGGNPNITIIPERDVYRLIMRSKLPEAEQFENWVVGEVLPQIRKTGSYQTPTAGRPEAPMEPIINQLNQFKREVFDLLNSKEQEVSSLKQEVSELKKQVINPAIVPRTIEQKKKFSVKKGQTTQYTKKFKEKIKKLAGLGEGSSYIWGNIWDEINYHVTGLDNAQLRMARGIPESGSGIRASFTFDELDALCRLLKYVNSRLETYSNIDKESAPKVISEICQAYQKE